jgi:hypothetical protein
MLRAIMEWLFVFPSYLRRLYALFYSSRHKHTSSLLPIRYFLPSHSVLATAFSQLPLALQMKLPLRTRLRVPELS